LALVSLREGLATCLAAHTSSEVHGNALSDAVISFFVKDFTKKTKIPLSFPPTDPADVRAEAKMRLAVAYTLKTLSAGPGVATCAVESLKDGYDYTGSISGMRFDMLANPTFEAVGTACAKLLEEAGVDAVQIDEVVYIGGCASLPGLDNALQGQLGLSEDVVTPHSAGTVAGGGEGDPTTILARGALMQCAILVGLQEGEVKDAAAKSSSAPSLSKAVGILFPAGEDSGELGGLWVDILKKHTPLPARRTVAFDVSLDSENGKSGFEVWEAEESVRIEKVKPPKVVYSDDEGDAEEEEEPEEEEVKHREVRKTGCLGGVQVECKQAEKVEGSWRSSLEVQFVVDAKGKLEVSAYEVGKNGQGEPVRLAIGA
jgi:molecular chaperone DnaK (HSP70)